MRAALALSLLLAAPANANAELLDFMGGQGCTFGTESRAAAVAAGFAEADIDALIATALAESDAEQQGAYVVLERQICTIRLPDGISSPYSVASPEIVAITTPINEFASEGQPGCFLTNPRATFESLGLDERDYYRFVAAGILSGDLRQFGQDPLTVPKGLRVVSEECAATADIDAIRSGHVRLQSVFGEYVRQLGERMPCEGPLPDVMWTTVLSDLLQEADATYPYDPPPADYNAWLWLEYLLIFEAAGWQERRGTNSDEAMPPLCHYD
ncbi:hypothetical protein [Tabrizicola aquatica]|uniref:hypothetical protein n=1 Tax=Tabrizicola aquatica TaxID=909926 RepID=UPI000CD25C10|nr:hypothetical protein [Tabrizicola aquatica]